jgi:succinate dehydrogenase / fumarate reductase flavoprotein subunit
MQGCADGYFVVPRVVAGYLAKGGLGDATVDHDAFAEAENAVRGRYDALLQVKGSRTVREFHWDLGRIMWDKVGMARNSAGLRSAIAEIGALRERFWQDVTVPGEGADLNKQLEQAGRVADFLELGELMARDALQREESCGGHFREEHKTEEGEARRDDEHFMHVSAWEHVENGEPALHKEDLEYENIEVKTRSYK